MVSKNGGELILFLKGNGLTEVYIKVVFILFIRTINNLTTTTCPVLVQGYMIFVVT